ncbi:MAG: glycosyltransferase [bacterium]
MIRTINERASLEKLLISLRSQKCSEPFEIIVVDNESTDGTKELALDFGAKVITLPRNEFSYPKSMNLGVKNTTGEYVVLTVGHALPVSDKWLQKVVENFQDKNVAGFYGTQLPRNGAHLVEFITYSFWYLKGLIFGKRLVSNTKGIMSATNCALRKSLWEKHPFDERYEMGGEDGEWAAWAINSGYKIILDPGFSLRHSHPMKNFFQRKSQFAYWGRLDRPTKFDRSELGFRSDLNFK